MSCFRTIAIALVLLVATGATASDRLLGSLQPRGYVSDFADVIPPAEESAIVRMAAELEQKTGAEIAVVTLKSLEGGQIDDFTNRLFERWGVGKKGKDNGLMFLAAMQERKMRIEVGYGLEGAIPDAKAGRIRRDIITPWFKAGNPGRGIRDGVAALALEVANEYGVQLTGEAARYRRMDSRGGRRNPLMTLPLLLLFGYLAIRHPFLALLLLSGGRGGGFRSGGGGFGGGGFGGGGFGGGMSGGGGSSGGW
jgi:uncharacterized protein